MKLKNNEREIFFHYNKETANLIKKKVESSIDKPLKRFVFFDILNKNKINFLGDFSQIFLMTKANNFGSTFLNDEVNNPLDIILSIFDTNLIMINIIFFTTYMGNFEYYDEKNKDFNFIKENASKFRLTNFNKFGLEDMFKDYFNKLKNCEGNINENDIEKNKEFIYEFLLPYYKENDNLEKITDKEIGILFY